MKQGILFTTMTGHSKKMAKAIGKAHALEAFDLKNKPQLEGYDQIFLISGVYGGKCKPELLEYVQGWSQSNTKKVVLMTSSATIMRQSELREALQSIGIAVDEKEFVCKGSFLFNGWSHPNKVDVQQAVEFVEQVLKG